MANPRKFCDKIARLNQKQAEGNANFEQIMKEVSAATHRTDLPNALSNFEELNQSDRGDAQIVYRDRGRSVGPIRQRPIERRVDTSPYGGPYLSPPPDTNWRRTNSDSAIHQSTQDLGQRRHHQHHDNQILGTLSFNDKSLEQRPKSCYDSSPVPGINIYPSHNEPGAVQIPIGNNTGSLPDLTSFHFPSPLPTPLDQEDHSSSFSTSPQGTSPSTLSPTSLPSRTRPSGGRFPFGGSSPQESRVPSPHSNIHSQVPNQRVHSPLQQRRNIYPPQQNLVISPHSPGGPHSPSPTSPLQNHLNVPSHISSSYLHQSKGVTQDHSGTVTVDGYSQQKFFCSPVGSPLVNCSLSPQPDLTQQQQQQLQQQLQQHQQQQTQINSLNSFRSPQPNRPSPQNSPGLQPYRSASPGDSHNSAPQSPASPAGSPSASPFSESNYIINQALQQHFEQFNMMDTPTSGNITYIPNTTSGNQVMSPDDGVGQELGTDPGYYSTSPSQLQYNRPTGNGSNHQTTPQTPNTPSSIPDIILTDFSSNATDDLSKTEFVKDLGSAMSGTFDSDFFPDESSLREELGTIDIAGFQMLTDPDMNVLSDPTAEDHFRLDRLDRL